MSAPRGIEPRTPVLVAWGVVQQRESDPDRAREPVRLMIDALERAAETVGAGDLLHCADSIRVPRGFWGYPDPARILAAQFGASSARTELAEIGVLQTTLLGEAARAIAAGEEEVVLIAGGEARHRERLFTRAGRVPSYEAQPVTTAPDRLLAPQGDILHPLEIERGIAMPVQQYAMIENALRARDGRTIAEHRREVAELWSEFSRVAAANPHAWSRQTLSPEEIATPSVANRMLAFPYTKWHSSQWNVDQAAGLILCSAAAARRVGIPEDRWVFPLAVADSNHMVPLAERRGLAASPGFRLAARAALDAAGLALEQVSLLEIYSCFPAAVRVQVQEIGITPGRSLTVTGGMAFAGGPLNSFVLQALAQLADRLTEGRGETALLTAVSGMLTKQGVALFGRRPPQRGFRFVDVSAEAAAATPRVRVHRGYAGSARVATYTVLYEGDAPVRAIVLCDTPQGDRTIATVESASELRSFEEDEAIGRELQIDAGRATA